MDSEHTRYLGVLGLLTQCSPYVPEALREVIEDAMDTACLANPSLAWRRVIDRVEINPVTGLDPPEEDRDYDETGPGCFDGS